MLDAVLATDVRPLLPTIESPAAGFELVRVIPTGGAVQIVEARPTA